VCLTGLAVKKVSNSCVSSSLFVESVDSVLREGYHRTGLESFGASALLYATTKRASGPDRVRCCRKLRVPEIRALLGEVLYFLVVQVPTRHQAAWPDYPLCCERLRVVGECVPRGSAPDAL
jgi:hypothetical protein